MPRHQRGHHLLLLVRLRFRFRQDFRRFGIVFRTSRSVAEIALCPRLRAQNPQPSVLDFDRYKYREIKLLNADALHENYVAALKTYHVHDPPDPNCAHQSANPGICRRQESPFSSDEPS